MRNSPRLPPENSFAFERNSYVLVELKEFVDVGDWGPRMPGLMAISEKPPRRSSSELENSIALDDLGDPETLRIGVAGGHTVFSLFYALPELELRRYVDAGKAAAPLLVSIDPLVAAPVPHSLYSAGAVAELAAQKLHGKANPGANLRAKDAVFEITTIRPPHQDWYAYDWLVLGIGSRESGSLKCHLAAVTDYDNEVRERAIGDISSRLYDSKGDELGRGVSNHFVNIELLFLEGLAQKSVPMNGGGMVVAIAGQRSGGHCRTT
jgi:hypothetical protein